ncbi:hypothetical protein OSSY52_11470 [Tepiditoga spiralis]|uniref:peptidylprolyl isomerase n=1 Tax=Tepiditoga spiralis TaxID=2108365 RepID=A0A7G1G6M5_9BACT|nr:peptidyl-prolyl cis-trans isomerase [Tepiditoga spiralis]BBE31006.1 hypothetical protein OSSY52_11470 [Tepiditoga spiralis]
MKKVFLSLMVIITIVSFSTVKYMDFKDNTVVKVNNDKVNSELLNATSKSILILQDLKSKYGEFYNTLTGTATGIKFLNTYNKEQAMKLVNQYLFIQFVESKGINLNRDDLKKIYVQKVNDIFSKSNISPKDINLYLLSKGYSSKEVYVEDNYLKALYKKAINELYLKKYDEIPLKEDEIKSYYNKNSKAYVSKPKADLKVIKINNTDEASLTYKKIIDGYYTFDEVYNMFKDKNEAEKITVNLNDNDKVLAQVIKNASGYIFEPMKYGDHYEIIKIEKKYPSKNLSYEEAKNYVERDLKDPIVKKYFSEELQKEFDKFKKNSEIIFNEKMF